MITLARTLALALTLNSLATLNPMKMIFTMAVLRTLIFIILNISIRVTWIALLLYMLFLGGILIRFIMVASLIPNEKSLNFKPRHFLLVIMVAVTFLTSQQNVAEIFYAKNILLRDLNIILMVRIILIYFLIFIEVITQTKRPLRTSYCHK